MLKESCSKCNQRSEGDYGELHIGMAVSGADLKYVIKTTYEMSGTRSFFICEHCLRDSIDHRYKKTRTMSKEEYSRWRKVRIVGSFIALVVLSVADFLLIQSWNTMPPWLMYVFFVVLILTPASLYFLWDALTYRRDKPIKEMRARSLRDLHALRLLKKELEEEYKQDELFLSENEDKGPFLNLPTIPPITFFSRKAKEKLKIKYP
jgi:hypothetical protein